MSRIAMRGALGRLVAGALRLRCYTVGAMSVRSLPLGAVALSLLLIVAAVGGVAAFVARADERVIVVEVEAPEGELELSPEQIAALEAIVDPSTIPPLPSFQCAGGEAMCEERAGELPEGFWGSDAPLRHPFPGNVPDGWSVRDDIGFRYTFVVPEDWHIRFADSGGYGEVFNPAAVRSYTRADQASTVHVTLRAYVEDSDEALVYRDALDDSSLTIAGGEAGVIEDRRLGEGVAKSSEYVFEREGAVFVIEVLYGSPVRPEDVEAVQFMLESITPY